MADGPYLPQIVPAGSTATGGNPDTSPQNEWLKQSALYKGVHAFMQTPVGGAIKQNVKDAQTSTDQLKRWLATTPVGHKYAQANEIARTFANNPIAQAVDQFTQLPVEGVTNVLTSDQRVVASRIANFRSNPLGVVGTTTMTLPGGAAGMAGLMAIPEVRRAVEKQAGNEAYAIAHPNDPSIQYNAQKAVHVDKLLARNPDLTGRLQNFLVNSAWQATTQPSMYASLGTESAAEMFLQNYDRFATAQMMSRNPGMREFARTFSTDVEARTRGLSVDDMQRMKTLEEEIKAGGRDVEIKTGENKGKTEFKPWTSTQLSTRRSDLAFLQDQLKTSKLSSQQLAALDNKRTVNRVFKEKWADRANRWVQQDATNLKNNVIGPLTHQRLLYEPYLFGTPGMREDALKMGLDPQAAVARGDLTQEEINAPPTGDVRYKPMEEYNPQSREVLQPRDANFNNMLVGEMQKYRMRTKAGYEKYKEETLPDLNMEPLYERIRRRFQVGREVVGNRRLVHGIEQTFDIGERSAETFLEKWAYGGFGAAKALSDVQTDAMLAIGAPHVRNIAVLLHAGYGERAVLAASRRFVLGTEKRLSDKIKKGAEALFTPKELHPASPVRLLTFANDAMRKATSRMLTRWDMAARATALDALDRNPLTRNLSDEEKIARVNDDIGNYAKQPHFVEFAKKFMGANFPQWHGYIVPTAMMRAVLRNPARVARLGMYEENFNDELFPDSPWRLSLGGGLAEFAGAVADPVRLATLQYPSYFGSESMLGWAGGLGQLGRTALMSRKDNLAKRYASLGLAAVPGGLAVREAEFNPYKEPGSPLERLGLTTAGPYFQKKTVGARRRAMQRQMLEFTPGGMAGLGIGGGGAQIITPPR